MIKMKIKDGQFIPDKQNEIRKETKKIVKELSFTAKTFEIVEYTYTLTNDDYDSISFQKEYGAV